MDEKDWTKNIENKDNIENNKTLSVWKEGVDVRSQEVWERITDGLDIKAWCPGCDPGLATHCLKLGGRGVTQFLQQNISIWEIIYQPKCIWKEIWQCKVSV